MNILLSISTILTVIVIGLVVIKSEVSNISSTLLEIKGLLDSIEKKVSDNNKI